MMNSELKPLPIGIQTFRDLIDGGFLYVDKTRYIYELIRYPKGVYFLSRPRRFGKSLLISTLDEIFTGERERFRGLWLYDSDYQWQTHPVIRIDFSRSTIKTAEQLEAALDYYLEEIAREHGIKLRGFDYQSRFDNLIMQLGRNTKVVILIDEYDKPILDSLSDLAEAQRVRDVLKAFYTIIKAQDQYIRLVFLTGISKFSRVGIFSGLNNLLDLSLNTRFAAMLGMTYAEVKTNFAAHVKAFADQAKLSDDTVLAQIRRWYNGFCFAANSEPVYNPFSTLQLFYHQRFSNYWFESGTPSFLVKLIRERAYDVRQLDCLELDELAFSTYDLERLQLPPLLFQTGYLSIKNYDPETRLYRLSYPNYEVENAFSGHLLEAFSGVEDSLHGSALQKLMESLKAGNLETFFEVLKVFFAQIPYDIQLNKEKYYQSLFYLIFRLLNLRIEAEKRTQRGRIDTVVELPERVYLFEFKLDSSAQVALDQIESKGYADGYRDQGKTLHLIGVNFDSKKRSITDWLEKKI